jgi:hypothetical protein
MNPPHPQRSPDEGRNVKAPKTQWFRSDTFHQIYLHLVFAVKYRKDMIRSEFSEEGE